MEEQRPVPGQVQIKADEKDLQGQYSNLVMLAPQFGGVHAEFYLHLPERAAGQAAEQRDRKSGAREAHSACAGRKYLALRSAIRANQGSSGGERAATECGFRAVKDPRKVRRGKFGTAVRNS